MRILRVTIMIAYCLVTESLLGQIAQSTNNFAVAAYKQLAEAAVDDNFVFSPLSLSTALRMTGAGASANTFSQMAAVLCGNEPATDIDQNTLSLMNSLAQTSNCKLLMANGLWLQSGYKLTSNYVDLTTKYYLAKCENVDFIKPRGRRKACNAINSWTSDHTGGKIKHLIDEQLLTTDTRLILTNAVYFKCDWSIPFRASNSRSRTFHAIDGSESKLTFMSRTHEFSYYADSLCQAISLPYTDNRFQFIVLLPANGQFSFLEQQLNATMLDSLINRMFDAEVELLLPKFRTTTNTDFTQLLKNMGITEAFTPAADFSKMTAANDLMIGKVLHKAIIEVDEQGTEAAAATAVMMLMKSAYMPNIIKFDANRPFIYLIWDSTTRTILFAGRKVKA